MSIHYDIKEKIDSIYSEVVAIRRKIHACPELGFEEFKTAQLIAESLKDLDYEVFEGIAKTGVVACLKGRQNMPAVAFRADMDALPMQEENDFSFASKNLGKMHACGHDGHVSILLGTAKILAQIKDHIKGQVVLIFQPAEEGPGGAKPLIASGILEKFNIKAIFGLHILSTIESGKVCVKKGPITASVDNFILHIKGKSAHGAKPENGVDAILTTCQLVNNLQSIISRRVSPRDSTVVTVGKIQGGYRRNIIADNVCIEGTVRCLESSTRDMMEPWFVEIIKGIVKAYGADYDLQYHYGYPPTVNDDEMTDLVKKISQDVIGPANTLELSHPELWGEDFAYYLLKYPGAFFYLGGAADVKNFVAHHNPRFDFDEKAMKIGIEIFVRLALLEKTVFFGKFLGVSYRSNTFINKVEIIKHQVC